jgi:hypothetical protein
VGLRLGSHWQQNKKKRNQKENPKQQKEKKRKQNSKKKPKAAKEKEKERNQKKEKNGVWSSVP